MKRFFASCGALVVGILLVGPVHAGPRHSNPRSGRQLRQHSSQRLRNLAGRPLEARRPRLRQLPGQWLPVQSPDSIGYDPNAGSDDPASGGFDPNSGTDDPNAAGSDPNSGTDDPNAAGVDPNSGDDQPGTDTGGANAARPMVTPKGGSQQWQPRFNKRSPRIPASRSRGR
jgi:hypothetical protein